MLSPSFRPAGKLCRKVLNAHKYRKNEHWNIRGSCQIHQKRSAAGVVRGTDGLRVGLREAVTVGMSLRLGLSMSLRLKF